MGNFDKKGVLGGFITSFIATSIIVLILTLYVVFSGPLRELGGGERGTEISRRGLSFSTNPESIIFPQSFKFQTILNCEGKFGEEKILFSDLIISWGDDSFPLINFWETYSCSNIMFKMFNLEYQKALSCTVDSCFLYDFLGSEMVLNDDEVEIYISNKTRIVLKHEKEY
jgi:hypothetical protein